MAAPRAWDEGIGTGVGSMDTEHRLQVTLVNAIEELVHHRNDPEVTAKTLGQLVEFTNVHFLSEELMMRLYSYPQHDSHKLEHARLIEQIGEIQRHLTAGDSGAALASVRELHDWLVKHIKSFDQAFALWCAKNRIHPE
jgi:hemerythrin-like metal-binding protein